ncbi:DUF4192 domain-containing protein [Streptomyces sp. Q6]|uniref:DUF4192 domain-containing protein n=1 Tax=Streptomyces citrinus TaxID=3118173 RepID=A0ACD5APM9_9ACTN
MDTEGTSVMAATAAYAGIQVRPSVQEVRMRLAPWETALVTEQTRALDAAAMDLVPRIIGGVPREEVEADTLDLARRVLWRLAEAPQDAEPLEADRKDDELVAHDEAAAVILGLQDRITRDRAAEWMEGEEARAALRLWRALARRCVGPYEEYAAAPLSLAGWVAWSLGDTVEADQALEMALAVDPGYVFARLLNEARADGVDPELVRRSLRGKRADRADDEPTAESDGSGGSGGDDGRDGGDDSRDAFLLAPRGSAVDPGMSRAARGLEAALRRRGERSPGAGTRPGGRSGVRPPRRPTSRRRVGRQRTRRDG